MVSVILTTDNTHNQLISSEKRTVGIQSSGVLVQNLFFKADMFFIMITVNIWKCIKWQRIKSLQCFTSELRGILAALANFLRAWPPSHRPRPTSTLLWALPRKIWWPLPSSPKIPLEKWNLNLKRIKRFPSPSLFEFSSAFWKILN